MTGWLIPWLQSPEWALLGALTLAGLMLWLAGVALRDLAKNNWEEPRR